MLTRISRKKDTLLLITDNGDTTSLQPVSRHYNSLYYFRTDERLAAGLDGSFHGYIVVYHLNTIEVIGEGSCDYDAVELMRSTTYPKYAKHLSNLVANDDVLLLDNGMSNNMNWFVINCILSDHYGTPLYPMFSTADGVYVGYKDIPGNLLFFPREQTVQLSNAGKMPPLPSGNNIGVNYATEVDLKKKFTYMTMVGNYVFLVSNNPVGMDAVFKSEGQSMLWTIYEDIWVLVAREDVMADAVVNSEVSWRDVVIDQNSDYTRDWWSIFNVGERSLDAYFVKYGIKDREAELKRLQQLFVTDDLEDIQRYVETLL